MVVNAHRVVGNGSLRAGMVEDREALLQRILESTQFRKSLRLRQLLSFVCERSKDDPSAPIREQDIGRAVFGRDQDYDTSLDNIVRVTASQARKKLELYFADEGRNETTILEIPKGQYLPVFRPRPVVVVEKPQHTPMPRVLVYLAASAPVLAIIALGLAVRLWSEPPGRHPTAEPRPTVEALWSQILPDAGRTDIVLSDSALSTVQRLVERPLTLADYLKPEGWPQSSVISANPSLQKFAREAARRHSTNVANLRVAYRIADLAKPGQPHPAIISARDFTAGAMKADNVILLGSARGNPWLELIQDQLSFTSGFDRETHHVFFENRQPRSVESKVYAADSTRSYCQVAFLPNLGRTGNILAIASSGFEATESCGEFVTSERSLAGIRKHLHVDGNGRLPHFEMLLESKDGAASRFSIAAFRADGETHRFQPGVD